MEISFFKYQGAGNDFIIINNFTGSINLNKIDIAKLCDRRFGIGADGFMSLEKDTTHSFYMRYFNSDGKESTMCGNGGRCIVLAAYNFNIINSDKVIFNSIDGVHSASLDLTSIEKKESIITLEMIDVKSISINPSYIFLNTGSPHYVEFVKDIDSINVFSRGKEIRNSKTFKDIGGTNVNFVEIINENSFKIRTFERGVEDETFACGTGAVASAIATNIHTNSNVVSYNIFAKGGDLSVWFTKYPVDMAFSNIHLKGPAKEVFKGVYLTKD